MMQQFRGGIRMNEDGEIKTWGGSIRAFLALHKGENFSHVLKKDRTNQQNKFMWVLFTIIGDEIGMDKDRVHDIFCFKYLLEEEVNEKTGEVFKRIKGTSELSKSEMMKFIDQIIIYCADELHIILPMPGENLKLDL
jgi:F0F1-type ATP synthase alpha subunit